ncbi:hypothetical protein [Streptomyces cyaneofuscatus]|uniref:hypothetical protein n=1 Tax=Streptomyces cyaneofuscatus TaxID=66883 RepID=UPI00368C56C6
MTEFDEERLRRALHLIGDEAGQEGERVVPAARLPRWRQWRTVGWVLAGAAVAGLVFGIAFDGGSTDGPSGPATEAKLSAEGWVACSQVMAEGEVVSVEEAPETGRVLLTVAVTDWFKPATGEKEARFDVVDPAKDGAYPRWKPGEHLLLVIDRDPTAYVTSYRGDDIAEVRRSIERALPGAAGRECTDGGRGDV